MENSKCGNFCTATVMERGLPAPDRGGFIVRYHAILTPRRATLGAREYAKLADYIFHFVLQKLYAQGLFYEAD